MSENILHRTIFMHQQLLGCTDLYKGLHEHRGLLCSDSKEIKFFGEPCLPYLEST